MGRLKNKNKDALKIKGDKKEKEKACEQYPAISFRYLTNNNKYNFKHFAQNPKGHQEATHELTNRLLEICGSSWNHWNQLPKNQGIELLEYSNINAKPSGDVTLIPDEKLIVFRFSRGDFRMVGFRKGSCPTLFVLAFDFNYSLYDHGK